VSERWILNASPLIVLARIGRTDLLFALADELVVPRAVAAEIQAGPASDPARQAIEAGKFVIMDTPLPPAEVLAWDLGAGETAVLSLALAEEGWTVILDDAMARKCARSFSRRVRGTLGIILLAKQRGLIPSAAEIIRSLLAIGFHLDDQTIREALARTTGERWVP
jgi:predicted nucleic acid-binding protein